MNNFVFGIFPYIALSVLLIGSIARYERDPFTWKSSSSQLLRRRQLVIGSVLFHVGVLVIFLGHLIGLLTPISLFHLLGISNEFKQTLAVVAGGIAGVMALVGGGMLLHRRWTDPRIRKPLPLPIMRSLFCCWHSWFWALAPSSCRFSIWTGARWSSS